MFAPNLEDVFNDLVQVGLTPSPASWMHSLHNSSGGGGQVGVDEKCQAGAGAGELGEENPDISGQHPNILIHRSPPSHLYAR